jgi:hypothetical protein
MNSSETMVLLFASGLPAHGYDFTVHTPAEHAAVLAELFARPGIAVSEGPAIAIVEDAHENTVWLVTRAGHFAHPSLLRRSLVSGSAGRSVQVGGCTAADRELMSQWMGQFRSQDEAMRGSALC